MPVLYANRASSTLASNITNVATSLAVGSGHGARFPVISGGDYFYATLDDNAGNAEVVRVTGRSGDTFTITRAQDGTSALAFSAGAAVELRIVRALLDDFKADTRTGYAPLTGTGASGTWGISISGNAATVSSITSAQVTTALGFTPYNATNPSGYITSAALSSYLPLTGGTLTGALTVGTAGSSSTARALRIVPTGVNPSSFGSYPGSWRSTLEIWDNAGTRMIHVTPPDGTNYNYSSIKSLDAGLRIDVGSNGGVNALSIETNGVVNAPQGLQSGGQTVLNASNFGSYALPLSGGTLSGSRPISFSPTAGNLRIQGDAAGWAVGLFFNGSSGTDRGGFGALGSADSLSNFYVGPSHSSPWMTFASGSVNSLVSLQQGGNQVLHAGNFNSYAPTLTGGGASGTWGINVTGSSGSSSRSIIEDTRAAQRTPDNYDDFRVSYEFTNALTGLGDWHSAMTMQGWHNGYAAWQIIGPASTSAHENFYFRSGVNATWNPARAILHSGNFGSYALPLGGGTVTGVTTFSNTQDWQLRVDGAGTPWAGIFWSDSDGSDAIYFRGLTGTYAIGGGGSAVSGKKLHVNGGTTIGSGYAATLVPSNGLNVEGAIQQAGNQVLHAGNFNSYSPSLTGSGASGTWGINVTGNAGTATALQTARNINGTSFNGTANIDTTEWYHSDRDFPNGTLITTNINYAVSSGDAWVLEIRGNSYSNIVPLDLLYQGYIYYDTIINHGGVSNGLTITGMVALNVGGNLCFWFPSQGYWNGYNVKVYAAFATRPTNRVTSITGTAKPSGTKEVALSENIRQSLHSGNYNSYSPTLTGSGASGTWGINVTGNAATATALQTARTINEVSFNGAGNITVPRVRGIDDRTAAPADVIGGYATFGFGSWNNNNTAPWADFWLMRSYTDASGGSDNMVMFRKDALGLRVWQQAYGSSTAFATFKDVAWTDGTNASGTWGISISGNAATAGGLSVHSGTNNEANKIVRTDGNGYANFGWIWTASGDQGTNAIDRVYASYDGYIRYYTPANFRTVLDVPTRGGSGASGTWGISISGNAATATTATTATSASQIDGIEFRNGDASNSVAPDSITNNGTGYVGSVSLFGQTDGALYSQAYSASWVHQIFGDYRTGQLAVRGRNSGTWQPWRVVLDGSNYTSYAPTLTGGGASGTWGINITGSAGSASSATTATTATNWGAYGGVPAAGTSFANANTIGRSDGNGYTYFNYINSNTGNSENPTVSQVIVTNGGDNFFRKASVAHLTSSLSGTAPINISGNAATATSATTASSANSVAWTNVSGRPTAVSSFSNDAGYITNTGNFTARAWVNFNGTGTVSIRASGNVSSITDNGVGDYTVNFTTAMPDTNYAVIGHANWVDDTHANGLVSAQQSSTKTTGAVRVCVSNSTVAWGSGKSDVSQVSVVVFR